ncbi:MAG: DNA polymerase III subunit gamma/tau, partial [Chthoniobacterales bacterium]
MSYEVFARKYRPQTFDDLVGQEHVSQTLKNAVAQNRLAHAYLFVGPRGIGKTSTARILAKALNCIHGPTVAPCGVCDNCREIAAGNSLDVIEIDGASNNSVEDVRELRDNVRYAPAKGRYKIYLIDEVHMLSSAAFNALLKTLEEPPAHVKFIFATTEPQKVLPTILSRCQRFDLHRIPANLIAKHLQFIAGKEKITLEPAAARAIARGAEGGLRDAESMLDQLVAFCGDPITEADVLKVFGFTSQQTVANLTEKILHSATADAVQLLHDECEAGKDMMRLMADLISYLRDLLVFKVKPETLSEDVDEELQKSLAAQAELIETDRLLELIDQFAEAEGRMKWAPNKKLHFEVALIKAIQSLSQVTLNEVIENLNALRDGKTTTPQVAAAGVADAGAAVSDPGYSKIQTARVAEKPATDAVDASKIWEGVCAKIPQEKAFLRMLV